ncbi:unnamed protein product [Bursaphelenchus xylophilus]|uniref:(pine wood nematode) hypothetical protein n=1 Tax=Bursaphelenchus xylophilus TaxID=6326 RepID=A0A1I7S0P8_BURXY|nr:unnamed protein product [Bursaphelenchus xylophilus]CAG9088227.1 unnamed protein product [Bursaphelenchus xylophilus]
MQVNPAFEEDLENIKPVQEPKPQTIVTEPKEPPKSFFGHKVRWVVMLLGTLCLSAVMCNSLALNFTVICMYKEEDVSWNNTEPHQKTSLYDEIERSWLFAAVAIGQLIGTIPLAYLTPTLGMKLIFSIFGAISAISTLLLPASVPLGFFAVFIIRMLQGSATATSFPAIGSIVAEWSTLKKSGTYIAWMSIHLQFAQVFTMPLGGVLCGSSWSWPSLYYIQGGLTAILFILFWFVYTDSPEIHKSVSSKELKTIKKNKVVQVVEVDKKLDIPYLEIMKDPAVIGIMLSNFGANIGLQFFFQYGPVYLNQVQGFDIRNTGVAAAFPYLIAIIVKFLVGPASEAIEKVPWISEKAVVIIFASLSQYTMVVAFVLLAYLPRSQQVFSQICYTIAIVASGLNAIGVFKSTQMICGRFVPFILSVNMFIMSLCILMIPFVVTGLAPNGTPSEWATLFVATAILVAIVTTIFNFTAQVTPRKWAYKSNDPSTNGDAKKAENQKATQGNGTQNSVNQQNQV